MSLSGDGSRGKASLVVIMVFYSIKISSVSATFEDVTWLTARGYLPSPRLIGRWRVPSIVDLPGANGGYPPRRTL